MVLCVLYMYVHMCVYECMCADLRMYEPYACTNYVRIRLHISLCFLFIYILQKKKTPTIRFIKI
jgi:hypothetical protein